MGTAKQVVFQCPANNSVFFVDDIHCKKMSESRTMYISTADNQWALWTPTDSPKAIDAALTTSVRDWDIDRVLWRGLQDEIWDSEHLFRKYNYFFSSMFEWVASNQIEGGVNSTANSVAKKNGLDIYLVYGMFEFRAQADIGGCSSFPYINEDRFSVEHPEWKPVNKYGTRIQAGPMEFCYPEARAYLVNQLTDWVVDKGYDGVTLYTYTENFGLRYLDEFGYNKPIVDEFKSRYGVDIRYEIFNKTNWAKLRGEYVTQFLNELHQSFAAVGKKVCVFLNEDDPTKPQYWPATPYTTTAGNIYMDWQTWCREGYVDEIAPHYRSDGSMTVVNTVVNYCWTLGNAPNVKISHMSTYGTLPANVVRNIGLGNGVESGYTYENHIGYGDENSPTEPINSLASTDVYARRRAVYSAEHGEITPTVAQMSPLVDDSDIYVQRGAIRALAAMGYASGVPYIESALSNSENSVRNQAAVSLGILNDSGTVDAVLDAMGSGGTWQYDFMAATSFLQQAKAADLITTANVTHFQSHLTDTDVKKRRAMARNLYSIDGSTWPSLESTLADRAKYDTDPWTRELCVLALKRYPYTTARGDVLRQIFETDPDPAVVARTTDYAREPNIIARFHRYGDICTRSDAQWGWRQLAGDFLLYIPNATTDLQNMITQSDDRRLAEIAWRSLYQRQARGAYSFQTEANDVLFNNEYPYGWKTIDLFKDDFESPDVGYTPYPWTSGDLDPAASVGAWSQITESLNYKIQLSRYNEPGANEKGQFIGMTRNSDTWLRGNFRTDNSHYTNLDNRMRVSFDVYYPSSTSGDMILYLRNSTDNNWDKTIMQIKFTSNGTVERYSAGNWVDTGLDISLDIWHKVVCIVDFRNQVYDIHVADKNLMSIPFDSTQAWAQQIAFTGLTENAICYLDDVDVELNYKTVFQDNFENPDVSSSEYPTTGIDQDPTMPQSGTWVQITETNNYDIQLTQEASSPEPGSHELEQYLAVTRTSASFLRGNFESAVNGNNFAVYFDMWVDNVDGSATKGLTLKLRNNTDNDLSTNTVCQEIFRADGTISHYANGSTYSQIGTFTTDTWHRVCYIFNFGSLTYSLSIDGIIVGSNLGFYDNGSGSYMAAAAQILFYATANGSVFYLDDIWCAQL